MVEATIPTLVTMMTVNVSQIARIVPVGMMAAEEPVAPAVVMKSVRKEIA